MKSQKHYIIFEFVILILFAIGSAHAQSPNIPVLTSRVTDEAGVLTEDQRLFLESQLKAFEDSTSNQIAVLIIGSVPGGDIESYSINVAEKNKLGVKGKDNGILFLIDTGDHKARIEVGYGLEGVVPDAIASYIINEIAVPKFRNGQYFDGIEDAVRAIMAAIGGTFHVEKRKRRPVPDWFVLALFISFFLFIIPAFFSNRRYVASSRGYRSGWWWLPPGGFGSGGGFGGGGGGFSGMGGSFGGGGASGSW
ncbi:MAG: TPM domain-containing protein [Candidatus Kryptoniota bacterium]